jgi:hypothetical protein
VEHVGHALLVEFPAAGTRGLVHPAVVLTETATGGVRLTEAERVLLEEAAKSKSLETSTWGWSELVALARKLKDKKS